MEGRGKRRITAANGTQWTSTVSCAASAAKLEGQAVSSLVEVMGVEARRRTALGIYQPNVDAAV